jgi:hypothetical protein
MLSHVARSLASQSGQAVACRSLARSLAFQSGRTLILSKTNSTEPSSQWEANSRSTG